VEIKIYKSIILSVVLYGCETVFHIEEEHRLKLFENTLLRKIFGLNVDEVTG
jgi:hypothetical protein